MTGRPNVIFVVLDTVRADRVSGLGYERETTPNLDSFAAEATTYTDAVAHAPWSVPSHASLFTGEYPATHDTTTAKPILTAGPTLPELLSDAGYGTYAFSANEYVRPATGFARGFDEFHTPWRTEPSVVADLLAPAVHWITSTPRLRRPVERAFNGLRESESVGSELPSPVDDGLLETTADILAYAEEPFFFFANLIDAHLPRSPSPEYVDEFVDQSLRETPVVQNERAHTVGEAAMDEAGYRKLSQLYDADLRTMDDRFGALLECFREAGVLSDSLVVVVSDHGEHLGEFDLVGHQFSVFDSVVSVPLVIQFPDGGPDRIDEQVETRRLFETVLDEAGVQTHDERSLASGAGDSIARGSYHSPMIDIEALLFEETVRYDPSLLGEPLSFVRSPDAKRLSFDGQEWLFETPEHEANSLSNARIEEIDRTLPGALSESSAD